MDALADKVHKQGEHIPQHCYISHNHPYINSRYSDNYNMQDGCVKCYAMLWNVLSLFVYFVRQCLPSSHPYTFGRFLFRNVL